MLVDRIVNKDDRLKGQYGMLLTSDAQGLYSQFGFKEYEQSCMCKFRQRILCALTAIVCVRRKYMDMNNDNTTPMAAGVYDKEINNTIPYYEQFYEQTMDVIEQCDYTELSRDMVRQRRKPKHTI